MTDDNVPNPSPAPGTSGGLYRQRIGFLGWRPDKPDVQDFTYEISTMFAAAGTPPRAFLPLAEKLLPPTRDQGDQGCCTGHSVRSAVQYWRALDKQPALELSPRFIYYNGRVIEGTTSQDAGAEIRDVIKAVTKVGVSSEALCPYNPKVYAQRPSAQAYREALTDVVVKYARIKDDADREDAVKQAILQGHPIVFGFTVYSNFMDDETARSGMMAMPQGNTDGGHAVWICGYDDALDIRGQKGGALIGNSWGTDWGCKGPNGSRGYFWMPWTLLRNKDFCDDFWTINAVS